VATIIISRAAICTPASIDDPA